MGPRRLPPPVVTEPPKDELIVIIEGEQSSVDPKPE